MSAEGQSYVEDNSPYSGHFYNVHLRLGLLSNDAHNYEIYCGDEYLARKCRCSTRTVKRAKAQLIKDGYLEALFIAVGHKPSRYRFIFKGQEVGGHDGPLQKVGGHPRPSRGTSTTFTPIYRKEIKESDKPFDFEPLPSLHDHAAQVRAAITAIKSLTNR